MATRRAEAPSQASPNASSNRLLNGALLGSCSTFSISQTAVRTPHAVQLDHYRRAVLETRKIAHLPLGHVRRLSDLCSAAGANQSPIAALAPHPQLQCLGFFVYFLLVYGVTWPAQNLSP